VSKIVATKIPDKLYEKLQRYKEERCFETDSEAVRSILREFLTKKEKRFRGGN
jgi:metal-responsive CopG/Arc/MetJ family transcriptional regulator